MIANQLNESRPRRVLALDCDEGDEPRAVGMPEMQWFSVGDRGAVFGRRLPDLCPELIGSHA